MAGAGAHQQDAEAVPRQLPREGHQDIQLSHISRPARRADSNTTPHTHPTYIYLAISYAGPLYNVFVAFSITVIFKRVCST